MVCTHTRLGLAAAVLLAAGVLPICSPAHAQQNTGGAAESPAAWLAAVRGLAAKKDYAAALRRVEQRLEESPTDAEARGWRARILGWSGRWPEAEAEFRRALDMAPNDADLLLGLASALSAQQRPADALPILDRAIALAPQYTDLHLARGRALRGLGRRAEARNAFREAMRLEPANADARAGLESVAEPPRHQLVLGGDFDYFNFPSPAAQAWTVTLRSDLSSRWTTLAGARFDHRSNVQAGRFLGSVTYRVTKNDSLTAGGSAGRDNGIIPKGEVFLEYGRGVRISKRAAVRGLELAFQPRWLWFEAARIVTLTPSVLAYLPRDWTWSLAVTAARSRFPGTSAEWRPSGITRVAFPLHQRVRGNAFFAVGTENFALVDQIGRFSARTWGGGARITLTRKSDVSFYVAQQDRSQGRAQTSFGIAYGVRF